MKKIDTHLDYVDFTMHVDNNFNIIHTSRFNPRFDSSKTNNECGVYENMSYFEIYPELDVEDSSIVECMNTGKTIFRESQLFTDVFGVRYHTKNITYPIIQYGKIIGAIELSQDITSVGDLNPTVQKNLSKKNKVKYKNTSGVDTFFENIITSNIEMKENIRRAKIFSNNDNPILIYGETGTGKEMFVDAMVNSNEAHKKKYIAQNCAAIPENLFESILFGSSKGAFTGAENKIGLLEMAEGGVLFLDELNSMPLHLQAKLLRVIQDRKVRRIGSTEEKSVNVKIIAAVNQNPTLLIKEKILREDLFYRLSSNTLYLLPLRERKEDIPIYIDFFIDQFNKEYNKRIYRLSTSLIDILLSYSWPGNVRELKHIIESMVNVSDNEVLTIKNLPIYLKEVVNLKFNELSDFPNKENSSSFKMSLQELKDKTERDYIIQALNFTQGNVSRAAELLELPRQTLKYKIDKLKIDVD